jgi:hypothetical protein
LARFRLYADDAGNLNSRIGAGAQVLRGQR